MSVRATLHNCCLVRQSRFTSSNSFTCSLSDCSVILLSGGHCEFTPTPPFLVLFNSHPPVSCPCCPPSSRGASESRWACGCGAADSQLSGWAAYDITPHPGHVGVRKWHLWSLWHTFLSQQHGLASESDLLYVCVLCWYLKKLNIFLFFTVMLLFWTHSAKKKSRL